MAHQRKVSEAVQVLGASCQDVGAWNSAVVYDSVGVGIGFVGMEEAGNRRMGHSGNLEAQSGIEVEAHSEMDSVVRSGKEVGIVEERFGIEEAVHWEIEVESRARLAGGIVEAAQNLDLEVGQSSAVVGEMETAIVGRAVIAERKVEERQSKMSFEVGLQMAVAAAAAGEDSLASQPCRNVLIQVW